MIKLPGSKSSSPSLAIEVNPVDSTGAATKKRGLVIKSTSELEQITSLLSNPKINQLANSIDGVNPKRDSATGAKGSSDIFEILNEFNDLLYCNYFKFICFRITRRLIWIDPSLPHKDQTDFA